MRTQPIDPIKAVTHADPYPYYRDLVERRPLYFDDSLKLWVAASADAVRAVLTSDLCRVRPTAEPVPKALLNSPAGNIFQDLVRMTDGPGHKALKQAVSTTLGEIDTVQFDARCKIWAQRLFETLQPDDDPAVLSECAFQLPAYVMGDLLGIPADQLNLVADWLRDFVRCLSPLSTPQQIERGKAASQQLLDRADSLLTSQQTGQGVGLFGQLSEETQRVNLHRSQAIANGIGFLFQAYEATAGLIGNTLITLARLPNILRQVKSDPDVLPKVIEEVLRYDAPVQNTRRFVAEDGLIAGEAMKAGDAILVILAAANHDAAVNPYPEHFDILRLDRQIFTFGIGVHACPGQNLAVGIASAGVRQWLTADLDFPHLLERFSYQDSVNVRIPLFNSRTRSAAQ